MRGAGLPTRHMDTQAMNESELTQRLDERGLLADARQPGVYALELHVPDWSISHIKTKWLEHYDVSPSRDFAGRIANAAQLAYVGASGNVYKRLCDHTNAEVRRSALLCVFPPQDVIDIWPCDSPFDREYQVATDLSRDNPGAVVWMDGTLI